MKKLVQFRNSGVFAGTKIGINVLGLATIAAGILDLIWGEFEAAHQPISALGDHLPGRMVFAYITAAWMILSGTLILWRRTARVGALGTAIIYLVFGMFWLPRLYTAPHILGFHLTVLIGVLGGLFSQLIVVAGAMIVYASVAPASSSWPEKSPVVARWTFGLGSVLFCLAHLTAAQYFGRMIPRWMPFGGPLWVVLTGIAFGLAGLAILSRVLNVLAARLLALMLLIFEVALVPLVIANPLAHIPLGSNAYNLAAAGAVWIRGGF